MRRARTLHATGWDVLGIGANSIDFVTVVPAFPRPEGWHSKMQIRRHLVTCGGQTATAMAVCARFGLRARYIGAVGLGRERRSGCWPTCHGIGVDASGVVTREGRNQFAVIVIDGETGERAVLWDRDAVAGAARRGRAARRRSRRRACCTWTTWTRPRRSGRPGTPRSLGIPVTSDLDRMTDRTAELVDAVTLPDLRRRPATRS